MKKLISFAMLLMLPCWMAFGADTKVTALTENSDPQGTDLLYMVDDPGGTPLSQKITIANLALNMPDIIVLGSDLSVGAAGVKLTGDGDGAITLLGLGNGSDEDLTLNLDDASNEVTASSSTGVTLLDLDGALDLEISGNDLTLGEAGVKFTSDGDGAVTLLGLGDGSDEDLTINLDDTANTAVISSSTSLNLISIGAIGITSTGTVTQAASVLTPTAIASLGAATAGKMVMTSDSGNATDCTTAGGNGINMCVGDGSGFVFVKSIKATA